MATETASQNIDASASSEGLPPSLKTAALHQTSMGHLPKGAITAKRTTIRMSELHQRIANYSESDTDWMCFERWHSVRAKLSPDAFLEPLAEQPLTYQDS